MNFFYYVLIIKCLSMELHPQKQNVTHSLIEIKLGLKSKDYPIYKVRKATVLIKNLRSVGCISPLPPSPENPNWKHLTK